MISVYKKEIFAAIFFFILPFILPVIKIDIDLSMFVQISSTIFAIVIGFLIADSMSNYLRLQTLISEENASLISIAYDVKEIEPSNTIELYDSIDRYIIKQLDLDSLEHFDESQKEMDDIRIAINSIDDTHKNGLIYDHILSLVEKIIHARQEMRLATQKTLSSAHWYILSILSLSVVFSMFLIRNGNIIVNILCGLVVLGVFLLLILLRDVDNNRLLEMKLAYRNPRDIFHAIGKPPYYPSFSPIKLRVPDEKGNIRVGK